MVSPSFREAYGMTFNTCVLGKFPRGSMGTGAADIDADEEEARAAGLTGEGPATDGNVLCTSHIQYNIT